MKRKRFLSVLLFAALTLMLLPAAAFPAEASTESSWIPDISWYYPSLTEQQFEY